MVPDTAQETPGRTLIGFLEALISGRGLQVQAVLGFQGALGPFTADRLVHQSYALKLQDNE